MTAQQTTLTRLLDWAAGQVAVMRTSYATGEDGWICDEEIREEVKQVEADIAALSDEDAGGGADHSRDFEGSDPRGMGPLPEEPGNPNPSFEQMENDTPPQQRDGRTTLNPADRDTRPQRGGWAPGTYYCVCKTGCGRHFIGDKRAVTCADCAYEGSGECSTCGGSGLLDGYDPDHPPMPGCAEPCPDCDPDATPPQQRDALEAFHRIITWSNEDYHHDGMHSRQADTKTVRRTLTNPAVPSVPEAVRKLPEKLRAEAVAGCPAEYADRGMARNWAVSEPIDRARRQERLYVADELDRALAQSGEGRVPDRISDDVREHLHDLADYYSRSVKQTCADANYALPDRILGRVAIDMRLCTEAAYWWGVGVAAPEPGPEKDDDTYQ